jgi:hypothetical protein
VRWFAELNKKETEMTCEYQDCDCDTDPTDLGSNLLKLSTASASEFIRQASALVSSALPGLGTFRLRKMCEIPETQCPPKSLGKIDWHGCGGMTLTQTIRLTNTSANGQVFTLSTTPFVEPGGAVAQISLNPAHLELSGGAADFVKASMTIPDKFPVGRYQTKILVIGAYEQYIDVELRVCSQQDRILEVAQGDIPVHIKAHRWYDHFQCVEPCFPPARKHTGVTVVSPKQSPATDK